MPRTTPKKQLTLAGPPRLVSEAGLSRVAKDLAKKVLEKPSAKPATVIALSGELGVGKTTFTKVFLKALGVRESVTSPTFILFRPYPLPPINQLTNQPTNFDLAYHIDCYRLENPKELLKLGLKEMLQNPRHLVVIEWAERVKKFLPKKAIWLKLEHGARKNTRKVAIRGF